MVNIILKALIVFLIMWSSYSHSQVIYKGNNGSVHFISDAPLENIEAVNTELQGIINTEDQSFAFACFIRDFNGFNSALQKQHFRENYMEMGKFPRIIFEGKIIEDINFSKAGSYQVRAKGLMTVHGVKKEKIINGKIELTDQLNITAEFFIKLENFNINIPKIVSQKIAEKVKVDIQITLLRE